MKKETGNKVMHLLLMHFSFVVYSTVAVFSKVAAIQGWFTSGFFLFVIIEFLVLGIYALLWQQVLKHFTLVKAYSSKGIVVIWNLLWAALFFGEKVTLENVLGGCVILIGVRMVSADVD